MKAGNAVFESCLGTKHGGLGVVVAFLTPFPVEMNVKETSAISPLHLSAKQKGRVRIS